MGEVAEIIDVEFVISSGDTHHYGGVQSINDPLWMSNYELIYTHPALQVNWYPLLGNHEYRGNTQAVIEYSNVSRRWVMVDRYYTQRYSVGKNSSLRLIYIDTTPLIDKYYVEKDKYPDVQKQSMEKQLHWLDSTLNVAAEQWKIVVGHHPIYAQTTKIEEERINLQKRVAPLLDKYSVNSYINGHIHNFQIIQPKHSNVDYITNTSASLSRKVKFLDNTLFCSPETGFILCSVTPNALMYYFINAQGTIVYKHLSIPY